MIVLVIGGSGSGKSEFAENICMELPAEEKRYIATMQAFDEESRARIAKHRKARSGKGFETIEQGTHLETVCLPGGARHCWNVCPIWRQMKFFRRKGQKNTLMRQSVMGFYI